MLLLQKNLTLYNQAVISLILLLGIYLTLYWKAILYTKPDRTLLEKNPYVILFYLDKFFIKSKLFTFSCCFIYVILNVVFILYIRFIYLGLAQEVQLSDTIIANVSVLVLLKTLLLILFSFFALVLYYYLINLVFYDEILKLYLYITQYQKIKSQLIFFDIKYSVRAVIGPLYLFFDNICNITENLMIIIMMNIIYLYIFTSIIL
jgi:hypothetical protein